MDLNNSNRVLCNRGAIEHNLDELVGDFSNRLDVFNSKVKNESNEDLNDLLLRLQHDFIPNTMYKTRLYSLSEIKSSQFTLKQVMKELKSLNKYFNLHKNKFTSTASNKKKQQQLIASQDFDRYLLEMNNYSKNLLDVASGNDTILNNFIKFKKRTPNGEGSSMASVINNSVVNEACSIHNRIPVPVDLVVEPQPSTSADITISEISNLKLQSQKACCMKARERANFKFNFQVENIDAYNPMIEKLIYCPTTQFDKLNSKDLPCIQFKYPAQFICLICHCSGPLNHRNGMIKDHVFGAKHMSKKSGTEIALHCYHLNWKRLERNYQSHQTFFYPAGDVQTRCRLCRTLVYYDFLKNHIDENGHKTEFNKKYHKKQPKESLAVLQKMVYCSNNIELQELEKLLEQLNKQNDEENPGNLKSKHKLVVSVANPKGLKLADILEYRFYSHMKFIVNDPDYNVSMCKCCNIELKKTIYSHRDHFHSRVHQVHAPSLEINLFYCEVCALSFKDNVNWMNHLRNDAHFKRCSDLPLERRETLKEYQCLKCNQVLFGDNIFMRSHTDLSNFRTNIAEIKLNQNVQDLFESTEHLQEIANILVLEANEVVINNAATSLCINDLENVLKSMSAECKAYSFGSRVSGLGNKNSDLDVYVDIGNMYFGYDNQDCQIQGKLISCAANILRKHKSHFSSISTIPSARTPIVQVIHNATGIDCDLSFRHGLSVENTKFIRFCIKLQPITQPMILILKYWLHYCDISDSISTYALAMMVIFYLQTRNFLFAIHELKQINNANILVIDGWSIMDFSEITEEVRKQIRLYGGDLKTIFIDFFNYYHKFHFQSDVVCPLLGYPIKKALFTNKGEKLPIEMFDYKKKLDMPNGECIKSVKPMCVQDPFDLSHNLTKASSLLCTEKFKIYCGLMCTYIRTNCI